MPGEGFLRLKFDGEQLDRAQTLEESAVTDEATIQLVGDVNVVDGVNENAKAGEASSDEA